MLSAVLLIMVLILGGLATYFYSSTKASTIKLQETQRTLSTLQENMKFANEKTKSMERTLSVINADNLTYKNQLKIAKENNPNASCIISDDRMLILREAIKSANATTN